MGYYSYITGGLNVRPRLTDSDMAHLNLIGDPNSDWSYFAGRSVGEDDTVGVVNGEIAVIPGRSHTEIYINGDDSLKAYDFEESAQALAAALASRGHTVEGAFYVAGEELDDRWRVRFENGQAITERPEWIWPNGDRGWG